MKTIILVSAVVAAALAAPAKDDGISGPKREKKSASYGPPAAPSIYGPAPGPAPSSYGIAPGHGPSSYGPAQGPASSSYGPAPSAAPSYGHGSSLYGPAPSPASYGPPAHAPASAICSHAAAPALPIPFYFSPAGHLPSPLHYRAENEREMQQWESMMKSEENHMEARAYDAGYGAAAGSLGRGSSQIAATGPALGLFPQANIGGCAVPLLLSCAPSITKGQLLKSHQASYSAPVAAPVHAPAPAPVPAPAPIPAPAPALAPLYSYRTNLDIGSQMKSNEDFMKKASQDLAQLSDMERAVQGLDHMHVLPTDAHLNPAEKMSEQLDHAMNQLRLLSPDAQSGHSDKM